MEHRRRQSVEREGVSGGSREVANRWAERTPDPILWSATGEDAGVFVTSIGGATGADEPASARSINFALFLDESLLGPGS